MIYAAAITAIYALVFSQNLLSLIATSGVLAIVLGFALQGLILDIFSGIILNLERPFHIGDWVNLHVKSASAANSEVEGEIVEMNWRTVRVKTRSGNIIIVPNSFISTELVTNYSLPDPLTWHTTRIVLDFSTDIKKAIAVLSQALSKTIEPHGPLSAERPPVVVVSDTKEYGIEYLMITWRDAGKVPPNKANTVIMTWVMRALKTYGIKVAIPQLQLHETAGKPSTGLSTRQDSFS